MARDGRMPDFFIVGAPRCGTGSLYHYLGLHPQVFTPQTKEPNFFARDFRAPGFLTNLDEYQSLYRGANEAQRIGDGSVWTLYSSVAPRLIREAVPHANAIVMVRDPVELMRSLHARNVAYGDDDVADFAAALELEPERAGDRRLPRTGSFPEAVLYTRVARLGEQVSRLLETFPRDDVHFVVLDDFAADPAREYAAVLRFLGVDDWTPDAFPRQNPNRRQRSGIVKRLLYEGRWSARGLSRALFSPRTRMIVRSTAAWRCVARASAPLAQREPLDRELRDRLREQLAPDVRLLGDNVGRDLAALWWAD